MPRIPADELDRLKAEIDLARLVEAQGYALKKHGQDYAVLCPFHADKNPSLIISNSKNVFHCLGCGAKGNVIDWVMQSQGVSFRHAVELLQQEATLSAAAQAVKHSTQRKLDTLSLNQSDQALLNHVIAFYHQTLLQNEEALAYLEKRGLGDIALIKRFQLGYANRTLAYRLPGKQYKAGQQLRGQLQRLGLLRASGHEHFNGSLIIPVLDAEQNVQEVYGRKLRDDLRKGTPKHCYLPGPHKGIFNLSGFENTSEMILCEALIDALTFYRAGYKNVTASHGVNGFTKEHLNAFKQHAIKRVLIAYDQDDAGEQAARALAKKLNEAKIETYRIDFPKGMDVNRYAVQKGEEGGQKTVSHALGERIRSARLMGDPLHTTQPDKPISENKEVKSVDTNALTKKQFEQKLKTVAKQREVIEKKPVEESVVPAQVIPDEPKAIGANITEHEINLNFGGRYYRIRGLHKNLSYEVLKINLLARQGERLHADTFDLYNARHRGAFIKQAVNELELDENIIKQDVGKVLLKLELLQAEHIEQKALDERKTAEEALSAAERQAALTLLTSPDLLKQILIDFNRCGVVGEETNKLAGYLACVSRKLDAPLAIIVQSTSAAGKSALMDALLNLMPEEDKVQYAAMTGQSLFYMGETDLKHKILAIVEEEGAHQASYALKLLQSEGELTIASTGKDPQTGRLETQEYRVEGPVMLFLTTTAIEIDDELLNRCLVLTVNEDREQTQAIHQLQRKKRTLEGLLEKENKKTVLSLHRNAQRLLKPLHVVNPYAEKLTFLDDRTRTRRDHEKYLTLIDSIALLHQYQRPQKTIRRGEESLSYIEVTLDDISVANELAHTILGRTLDELPPQTRRLLKLIYEMVKTQCDEQCLKPSDVRFARREVRDFSNWSDTALKVHMQRLVELEYLLIHRGGRGQSYVYELLYVGGGEDGQAFLKGLIDIKSLKNTQYDAKRSGQNGQWSAPGQGAVSPRSEGSPVKKNGKSKSETTTYPVNAENALKNTYTVNEKTAS